MVALRMDAESTDWVQDLKSEGATRAGAVDRLRGLLLRVGRAEAARRRGRLPEWLGSELDDLCDQAATDAVMSVLRKLDTYRGEARFTTWASKFVILELSSRLRRRQWRGQPVETDETVWSRLPDSAPTPLQAIEHAEILAALGRAVREDLTERQRLVFQAAVIKEVPIDVLAERLNSSRGAIYKTLHDARRRLREALARDGYTEDIAV